MAIFHYKQKLTGGQGASAGQYWLNLKFRNLSIISRPRVKICRNPWPNASDISKIDNFDSTKFLDGLSWPQWEYPDCATHTTEGVPDYYKRTSKAQLSERQKSTKICSFWMTLTSMVTLTFYLRSWDQNEVTCRCYMYHHPKYELNPSSGLGWDR